MKNYGYIRIANIENNNLELQKSKFSKIKIDKFFEDLGVSGLTLDRKGLNELLDTVKNGDNIYVSEISRLSRNIIDTFKLIKSLHDKGVNVFTLENPLHPLYEEINSKFLEII